MCNYKIPTCGAFTFSKGCTMPRRGENARDLTLIGALLPACMHYMDCRTMYIVIFHTWASFVNKALLWVRISLYQPWLFCQLITRPACARNIFGTSHVHLMALHLTHLTHGFSSNWHFLSIIPESYLPFVICHQFLPHLVPHLPNGVEKTLFAFSAYLGGL